MYGSDVGAFDHWVMVPSETFTIEFVLFLAVALGAVALDRIDRAGGPIGIAVVLYSGIGLFVLYEAKQSLPHLTGAEGWWIASSFPVFFVLAYQADTCLTAMKERRLRRGGAIRPRRRKHGVAPRREERQPGRQDRRQYGR